MIGFGEGAQPPNLDLKYQHLREFLLSFGFHDSGEAAEIHPLITPDRVVGNGHYFNVRHYPDVDEVEICAIRLDHGDSLRRGGGAKRKNTDKASMDEATATKSANRARTAIRRKCLAMGADRMLTLTFQENVTDLEESWGCFKYFTKLMRSFYKDKFSYVAVPEYQKRGAVHFHLALKGFHEVGIVRRFWRRAAGRRGGNIDITSPKKFGKRSWNPKRIAVYLAKYLSKNDSVQFNKRRYSSGGKIQLPDPERGWLALGVPVGQVMVQIVERRTRKRVETMWESEGFFGITYCST